MKSLILILAIFTYACASSTATHSSNYVSCLEDVVRQEDRSKELAKMVQEDQNDRVDFFKKSTDELVKILKKDEQRRRRVGEIFGEGCFKNAEDFAAAALIYQHGKVPDHFFQAFLWVKRSVELGDASQKRLMALAIDRYLVSSGKKQLFGSQASKPDTNPKTCWCIEQIERSFPDKLRSEIAGKSFNEVFNWLDDLNKDLSCPRTECQKKLEASPKGTVPGFW
ncbi:MAG: hypothetical protein KDD61_14645 [Bdellovibrionales bacterium]|nr:hypothetical protein [Bdellovibrionales bacterium]